MTEFADDRTECIAGGREPILVARPICRGATLDRSVQLQIAQPCDQYSTRYQRYPAVDVVKCTDISHQFAQDEGCPAHCKDFSMP